MRRKRRAYRQNQIIENGENGGRGAWTERISSPFSIGSCGAACLAGVLAGISMIQAIVSAGNVSIPYAGLGLLGMPVAILGLWMGIRGKYDLEEKRQLTGMIGCVANGTLFIILAGLYGAGLFWQ